MSAKMMSFCVGATLWIVLTAAQLGWVPLNWVTLLQAVWATIAFFFVWRVARIGFAAARCVLLERHIEKHWHAMPPHVRRALAIRGIHTPSDLRRLKHADSCSEDATSILEELDREQQNDGE